MQIEQTWMIQIEIFTGHLPGINGNYLWKPCLSKLIFTKEEAVFSYLLYGWVYDNNDVL